MKHIKTLNTQTLNNTVKKGGCGECQTSCQSAKADAVSARHHVSQRARHPVL